MSLESSVLPFLPEIVLLAAALLIFLLDVARVRRLEVLGALAVVATLIALVLVLADLQFAPFAALSTIPPSSIDAAPSSTALYSFSSLGLVFQAIFLSGAFLVSFASLSRDPHERGGSVFFGLLLLATLGMLLVAVASDLIFLLLAIEIVGISTYLMVAYTRRDARSLEAAMKFYIIGALSTALSFFGASLLYGAYGTTNLYGIVDAGPTVGYPTLALVGYGLLLAGLAFKVTAVPFHAWAVDVYDGAPNDVSAFLAGGTKKMGLFAFFLVFIGPILAFRYVGSGPLPSPLTNFGPSFQLTLGVLSVLTMTVGNLLALQQQQMKRMLAYSSISQAGYMLMGIAIGTAPALAGATMQIFAHTFMKTGAFLVVAGVASLGVGPRIEDWRGLGQRRPFLGVAFGLMLLGLAGIPLTVGFVSKFVLFSAAIQAQGYFVWLAVAGLLNSALSVFYYARVLRILFAEQTQPGPLPSRAEGVVGGSEPIPLPVGGLGWARSATLGIITAVIVVFGVYPQPILSAFQAAAMHFVAGGA